MSAAPLPWSITDASDALRAASKAQKNAEDALTKAASDRAHTEELYRKALAKKIVELRAEKVPATTCADIARGDEHVSRLRFQRDLAAGSFDAVAQACWRAGADRKDAQRLADWSMRRELAEGGSDSHRDQPSWSARVAA